MSQKQRIMWRTLTIHPRSVQPLMEGDLVDVSKAVTSYGGLDRSLVRRWVAQLVSPPFYSMTCLFRLSATFPL